MRIGKRLSPEFKCIANNNRYDSNQTRKVTMLLINPTHSLLAPTTDQQTKFPKINYTAKEATNQQQRKL